MREKNRHFHVILMFREPLSHASHCLPCTNATVTCKWMIPLARNTWDRFAHHEFGLGQKPYRFPTTSNLPKGNPMELDYWIESWINQ